VAGVAATNGPNVLKRDETEELKEEMFQLEVERALGHVSQQEYEKTKASLVSRLERK